MRYMVGFAMALTLLASPLSASAEDTDGRGPDERPQLALLLIPKHLQERLPEDRHAVSKPESKFSLEYQEQKSPAVHEMELRVRRARIGLGVSGIAYFAGASMGLAAFMGFFSACFLSDPLEPCAPDWVAPLGWTGVALAAGGLAGMIASGVLLHKRKRDRDSLRQARYGGPRRVQWDLARSQFVF